MLEIDIKLLPFQGVTNERALTQGVASLALGYVHHWAFSPSLLNPKLQLSLQYVTIREIIFFREFDEFYHNLDERTQEK